MVAEMEMLKSGANRSSLSLSFLFVDWDEEWRVQVEGGHTIQIFSAAARIKTREDRLRRSTRDIRTRVAKCAEVDGGIFHSSLWTGRNLSFLCNKYVI